MASGKVGLNPRVTHIYTLDEFQQGFAIGSVKVQTHQDA